MFKLLKKSSDLCQIRVIANKLANNAVLGDLFLLQGELGAGKTTLARFIINSFYDLKKIKKPTSIKSPSFPIMINYPLSNFEVFHYDLYRLINENELKELNISENLKKNITLIEWPQMIINSSQIDNYFFINLEIITPNERMIEIKHTHNKHFNNEF